jgi:hypothetical protein
LHGELQRLTTEAQSLAAQREKVGAELAHLRGELAAAKMRENKTELMAQSPDTVPSQTPTDAAATEMGRLVHRAAWRNIGFQTPSAAVQTLEWARINGDTNVIANGLVWADDKTRGEADAIFSAAPESVRAKYGSVDQHFVSLFTNTGPTDPRHTLVWYRIFDEEVSGDEAIVKLEYHYAEGDYAEPSTLTCSQRYVRIGHEWRQVLDFDFGTPGVQAKVSAGLQAEGAETPLEAERGHEH